MMLAGMREVEPFEVALLRGVAKRWGLTPDQVRGHSRVPHIVAARRDWVSCVYGSCGSLSETSRRTGRDHSTVTAMLRRDGLTGPLGIPPAKAGAR
jgi:hypothetical protein